MRLHTAHNSFPTHAAGLGHGIIERCSASPEAVESQRACEATALTTHVETAGSAAAERCHIDAHPPVPRRRAAHSRFGQSLAAVERAGPMAQEQRAKSERPSGSAWPCAASGGCWSCCICQPESSVPRRCAYTCEALATVAERWLSRDNLRR